MLHEINPPGFPEGNLTRRWFADGFFDLFVWLDAQGAILAFQLCYDKGHDEHAITWRSPSSYFHQRVDDGENGSGIGKATPILVPNGTFDFSALAQRFKSAIAEIDPQLSTFVYTKIVDFARRTVA